MKILYFAQVAQTLGRREDEIVVGQPLDRDALWDQLVSLRPELARYRACVHLSRNREYARADEAFQNDDEVALLPPVSGG
jgi:MoaE-MoaD fusion protein